MSGQRTSQTSPAARERKPRGRPVRYADRRHEVLRTSARVFSERGFRQATLEDVAAALHMTRPALYHYAKSKDGLLGECLDLARDLLDDAVADARQENDGLAQLKIFFRRYAEIVCDDFGRCFVLTARSEMTPHEAEKNRAVQAGLGRAVMAMVRKGMRDGSIRDCNPTDVSRLMFAAFNGIPRWRAPGHKRSPSAVADEFLALLEGGLKGRGAQSQSDPA